jgi:hypothetical protein
VRARGGKVPSCLVVIAVLRVVVTPKCPYRFAGRRVKWRASFMPSNFTKAALDAIMRPRRRQLEPLLTVAPSG